MGDGENTPKPSQRLDQSHLTKLRKFAPMSQRGYADTVPFKTVHTPSTKKKQQPFRDRGYGYDGDASTGKEPAYKRKEKYQNWKQYDSIDDESDDE